MCKLCNSSEEIITINWNNLKSISIEFMKLCHQYTGKYPCIKCRRAFREYCRHINNNEINIDNYIIKRMKFFYIQKSRSVKNRRIRDAQRINQQKYNNKRRIKK